MLGSTNQDTSTRPEVLKTSFSTLTGIRLTNEKPGRAYTAYPSLEKVRWLLPADHPAAHRAGVDGLVRPSSLRGRAFKALAAAGGVRGERVWLEEEELEQLEAELSATFGRTDLCVALAMGVPGAYRKVTAQVITSSGETLAYAKIGTLPSAQAVLEDEYRALSRLSEAQRLRGRVPEVLSWFDWHGGKGLLLTSGPERRGPQRLSRSHREFCGDVFFSFSREGVFEESPMWTRMVQTARRLSPYLPPAVAACYDRALATLREEMGEVALPLSLAHRDFIPWNTRMGPGGLFVFDWERAQDGMTPLYDVFCFQTMQAALSGRRRHLPDRRFMESFLGDLWPGGREYLPWLYLAYLVDMSLLYSEARIEAPGVGEQRVWRWFMERIEAFSRKDPPL